MVDLNYLQEQFAMWQMRNFGPQPSHRAVFGVGEEYGELLHAILKSEQGIRGKDVDWDAKGQDAVGDMIIFLMQVCSARGWKIEKIIQRTALEVLERDWKRFPKNGTTE